NLPWHLDEPTLAARCGFRRVRLLNDFEATAYGVLTLKPSALHPLQAGQPREGGAFAVIGAGTGLGEAIIFRDERGPRVVPSEGGHADYAPRDDVEIELLKFLRNKFG